MAGNTGSGGIVGSQQDEGRGVPRQVEQLAPLAQDSLPVDPQEAAHLALAAIEQGRSNGDRLAVARAMLTLSQASLESGSRPSEVYAPIRLAISELSALGDTRSESEAQLLLAKLFFEESALEDAVIATRAAKRLAKDCNDAHLGARCDLRLAAIYGEFRGADQAAKAHSFFERAASQFLQLGDTTTAATAVFNMAIGSLHERRFEDANSLAGRCLELTIDPQLCCSAHILRAIAVANLGQIALAHADLAIATKLHESAPSARRQVELHYALAVVLRTEGAFELAESTLFQAIEGARTLRDSQRVALYLGEMCDLRVDLGDLAGALKASRLQYQAQADAATAESARRLHNVEIAERLEGERRQSDALAASHRELRQNMMAAESQLVSVREQLDLERTRRGLIEQRAAQTPGIESHTGLPDLVAISGLIRGLLDSSEEVAIVVITIDDDRLTAPLPDDRQHLIRETAARCHAHLRRISGAITGSLGTEDLVVVLPLSESGQDFRVTLSKLHAVLVAPVQFQDRRVGASVQMGVALAPMHGIRPNGLLSRARLAAQAARHSRPHGPVVAVFTDEVEQRQQLRNFVHENLSHAIEQRVLTVSYQPIVDAYDRPVAAEALVRWVDPVRGNISPADFIPLAEETGHIVELGGFVLKQACCDAVGWDSSNSPRPMKVAVNVSAAQLLDGTLTAQVSTALLLSGLPATRLSLELTESALADSQNAIPVLKALRDRGVTIKIDDFGTGYSSFSYLTRFPVDCVKIDKTFVDRITDSLDDASITQSIISMAHALRMSVIAEGVESQAQADLLRSQGCDRLQGYLFSRPIPADAFEIWLSGRNLTPVG